MPPNQMSCSTISLNSALDACAQGSQWEWSVHLLAQPPITLAPNEISSRCATAAYSSCNLWANSLQMLLKMKDVLLRMDEIMYNSVASSFEHSHHWLLTTCLFQEMSSMNIMDHISVGLILSRFSEAAPWPKCLQLASEMPKMRLPLNPMSQHALVKSTSGRSIWRWALHFFHLSSCDWRSLQQLAEGLQQERPVAVLPALLQGSQPELMRALRGKEAVGCLGCAAWRGDGVTKKKYIYIYVYIKYVFKILLRGNEDDWKG